MDPETIRKIALEGVHLLPSYGWTWPQLVLQVLLTAAAAGAGAFFSSYLKTRGQNLATKADFDSLQGQLSAQTELVEKIKSEVSQRDWAQREWTNLRRIKLEALLEKMHECATDLERCHNEAIDGSKPEEGLDLIDEFDTIADMYFQELSKQTYDFATACREEHLELIELAGAVRKTDKDSAALKRMYDDFSARFSRGKRLEAQSALQNAARSLLERIMNVDESREERGRRQDPSVLHTGV